MMKRQLAALAPKEVRVQINNQVPRCGAGGKQESESSQRIHFWTFLDTT